MVSRTFSHAANSVQNIWHANILHIVHTYIHTHACIHTITYTHTITKHNICVYKYIYTYASTLITSHTHTHTHTYCTYTHVFVNKDKCDWVRVRVTLHVGWETEDPDIAGVRALALNPAGAFWDPAAMQICYDGCSPIGFSWPICWLMMVQGSTSGDEFPRIDSEFADWVGRGDQSEFGVHHLWTKP